MKRKGFTLIELLAAMAIIVIVVTLAVPSLINELKSSKQKSLDKNKEIIISAAKNYMVDNKLAVPTSISVISLCSGQYIECPIVNPVDDSYMIGFVDVDLNKNYIYSTDTSNFVTLTINLNGGLEKQTFQTSYKTGSVITLISPTKKNYRFLDWDVEGIGSSISGSAIKSLIVGTSDTTITANWQMPVFNIIYNLNHGTVSPANPITYQSNTPTITLNNATKLGYTFTGWTGSNGTIPQIAVAIPEGSTGNKNYIANFTKNTYSISYNLAGGTVSPENRTTYQVDTETFTLTNPIKLGHIFTGWTGSNGSAPQMAVTIPTGSTENKSYTANWISFSSMFTFTLPGGGATTEGTHYQIINDTTRCASCWKIKLLVSGIFTPSIDMMLDVFAVGGGGGGGRGKSTTVYYEASGGGGGYTKTSMFVAQKNVPYTVTVGAGGAAGSTVGATGGTGGTSLFGSSTYGIINAAGGYGGRIQNGSTTGGSAYGGAGGSGGGAALTGAGGSDGSNGGAGIYGILGGQGTTTREFGESTGALYSGGGGGCGWQTYPGPGGAGGGGNGSIAVGGVQGTPGGTNTGGGGGGGANTVKGTDGGSGIVVIRNSSFVLNPALYGKYTGSMQIIDDSSKCAGCWKIKFLTSGTYTPSIDMQIDVFVVGGGGAGGTGKATTVYFEASGGGGGYTRTETMSLIANHPYDVVIGAGGIVGTTVGATGGTGGTSSFDTITAAGGYGGKIGSGSMTGGSAVGGAGGSGGGSAMGGAGGSDGSVGGAGGTPGPTTREFGEADGELYAGGGGGCGWQTSGGPGGAGGGGNGIIAVTALQGTPGKENTGGGGGGGANTQKGMAGGSGVVVIRNHR